MLLAELNVRHTRRHMPTRRVAVDPGYLPTSGSAFGPVLLGAVVAEHIVDVDEEQLDALDRLLGEARHGLSVPRIALRYRLQRDTHGLDLSRHHILGPDVARGRTRPLLELDRHGRATPQVLGAIMAAAELPESGRRPAFRAIDAALARPGMLPDGFDVVRRMEGLPGARPYAPGAFRPSSSRERDLWAGVPADRRWAMEVLGVPAGRELDRDDVQRRFRRLVRVAHPDHGADHDGAADRLAELAEARELLLEVIASAGPLRPRARPAG